MSNLAKYKKLRDQYLTIWDNSSLDDFEKFSKIDIRNLINIVEIYQAELKAQNIELLDKENHLASEKIRYKNLFDNAPIAYVSVDFNGQILYYNNKSTEILEEGRLRINKAFMSYLNRSSYLKYVEIIDTIKNNETKEELLEYKYAGSKIYGLTSVTKESHEGSYLIAIIDMTKQIEQDELLQRQSKIISISEMLNNIAHHWRQPLNVITMSSSMLKEDYDLKKTINDSKVDRFFDQIIDQANYLSRTIDEFRSFFKSDDQSFKSYKVDTIFKRLNLLLGESFKNNSIQYSEDIPSDLEIETNESLLIQAFINIYNNAKDAILKNVENVDERYFFVDIKKHDNNLIFKFTDSGGGIDDEIIDKIYEPYFTTKHSSVGTGIGLYMTYQIISKNLIGTIESTNVEYKYNDKIVKGAEFKVVLPISS